MWKARGSDERVWADGSVGEDLRPTGPGRDRHRGTRRSAVPGASRNPPLPWPIRVPSSHAHLGSCSASSRTQGCSGTCTWGWGFRYTGAVLAAAAPSAARSNFAGGAMSRRCCLRTGGPDGAGPGAHGALQANNFRYTGPIRGPLASRLLPDGFPRGSRSASLVGLFRAPRGSLWKVG